MKINLLFRNKDFDPKAERCFAYDTLKTDLGLDIVLSAMARGNTVIYSVCETALFNPLSSLDKINYRQENLKDAIANAKIVRRLYDIVDEAISKKEKMLYTRLDVPVPSRIVSTASRLLSLYLDALAEFRTAADGHFKEFSSEGFCGLLSLIRKEITDEYINEARGHLDALRDNEGVFISARFGNYLQGVGYTLMRKDNPARKSARNHSAYILGAEDRAGYKELERRYDYAVSEVADTLAQSAEHLDGFFRRLRDELGFYVGCINLADTLSSLEMKFCVPEMLPVKSFKRGYDQLFDIGLAVVKGSGVVGNTLSTEDARLYIITGVNQGGKTTFLRSLGQAQLMGQCGMITGAVSFSAPVCKGIFTHFRKEEDREMKSGKLEEELLRMNGITENLKPGSLVLFNESFAATNEREGSEIHTQIVKALVENDIEVFSVTHLTVFALAFSGSAITQFLRAEKPENNIRTYKLIPEEPRLSSFDTELFESVFGDFTTDKKRKIQAEEDDKPDSVEHFSGTGYEENENSGFVSAKSVRIKQFVKGLKSPVFLLFLVVFIAVITIYLFGSGTKLNTRSPFVVNGKNIFYSDKRNGSIYHFYYYSESSVRRLNHQNSRFLTEKRGRLYYSDDYGIYSMAPYQGYLRLTADTGQYLWWEEEKVFYFFENEIKSVKVDGSEDSVSLINLNNSTCYVFIISDGRIYYNDGSGILSMNIEGADIFPLVEDDGAILCADEDRLYYINRGDNNALYRIRKDGSERERLCDDPGATAGMSVNGEWLYFCNIYDKNRIYRMRTDGSHLTCLTGNRTFKEYIPEINDGWIYYVNIGKGDRLYKMKPDGSENRPVIP